VAYYPFFGNAKDTSGNGFDGIVIGPQLVQDRDSNQNGSYTFQDNDDYIAIDFFEKGISSDSSFSIVTIFKADLNSIIPIDANNWDIGSNIFQIGSSEGALLTMKLFTGLQFTWSFNENLIYVNDNKNFNNLFFTKNVVFSYHNREVNPEKYCHVVSVFDRELNLSKLYFNGTLYNDSVDIISDFPSKSLNKIILGPHYLDNAISANFSINLDEFRVYNRALSESEIQQIIGN